jgi:AmmeMemoRadiSam system protein A
MSERYAPAEEALLLSLARQTLDAITQDQPAPLVDLGDLPPALAVHRACFVTLRRRADGGLRGCTGTLVARRPLAHEVINMTAQTAFHDPRFLPVRAEETPDLLIEISVLTPPQPLVFDDPADLLHKLRPGVDGVTLYLNNRRATFLPQVWDAYPDPRIFLSLLSEKMGGPPDAWRDPAMQVETYQAIIIEESLGTD